MRFLALVFLAVAGIGESQTFPVPVRVMVSAVIGPNTNVDTSDVRRIFATSLRPDSLIRVLPPVVRPNRSAAGTDPRDAMRLGSVPAARYVVDVAVQGTSSGFIVRLRTIEVETTEFVRDSAIVAPGHELRDALIYLGARASQRIIGLERARKR